jgi:hypothetical protein
VPDPDLVAYAEALERHLSRLRGVEHVLTPPDFALSRSWYEAGIPLVEVLAALDEAAGRGAVSGLRSVRKRVESAGGGRGAGPSRGG